MGNFFSQSFFIPKPTLTEQTCPDQKGRVSHVCLVLSYASHDNNRPLARWPTFSEGNRV
jgi:hypothetical protein